MAYDAYKGIRTCDRCNMTMPRNGTFSGSLKYHDLCEKCKSEIKHQKNLENRKDSYLGNNGGASDSSSSNVDYFQVIKWIFFFLWGGIYLLVKGIQTKEKLWVIIGTEFTIVSILAIRFSNTLKDNQNFEWLVTLFAFLMLLNLIPLIWYVKNKT